MTGSPDPQTAMQREQAFRQVPHLVQLYELGFMRSPQEVSDFMRRYGLKADDVKAGVGKLRAMGAM
jgi:NAD-dependent DNA ligase